MDWYTYSSKYLREGEKRNIDPDVLDRFLAYAYPLFIKKLPVIFDELHLSYLVGYKLEYIFKAIQFEHHYYRRFAIKKKNGSPRFLAEPLPSLKEIQYWILKLILEKQPVSAYAKAYKKKHSVKSNARFHQRQKYVLTVDIRDFFGSITPEMIYEVFHSLGYSTNVSNTLTGLCTYRKALPQGAPTSPCLSNIIAVPIDELIGEYCLENGIRYTRYSDDLTFSGDFHAGHLLSMIEDIITSNGFELNDSKTRLLRQSERQRVTGIVVNQKMQAPKAMRRKFRQSMYYIRKFGFDSHIDFGGITRRNYLNHLIGIGNYIYFVNNSDEKVKADRDYLIALKRDMYPSSPDSIFESTG